MRHLYDCHRRNHEIGVIEGVMGYYDGLGFTEEASTYCVARALQVPVILMVDCKGMGNSVMATVEGFLRHGGPNLIKGVIFNRISSALYEQAAQAVRSLGIVPLGFLPDAKVTDNITYVINKSFVNSGASDKSVYMNRQPNEQSCRIAVARDEAFCFLYEDNLNFLREHGAQIVPFSPLHDSMLPECDALYLSGGYPELYAEKLADNRSMRDDIKDKVNGGLPCIAECGGFLYLHDRIESKERENFYSMTGVIESDAINRRRRGHFGYIEVTLERDCLLGQKGDSFRAHEFHYWESTAESADLTVFKPGSGASWREGICTDTLYAGFPHLYFHGSPKVGECFIKAACAYSHKHEQ